MHPCSRILRLAPRASTPSRFGLHLRAAALAAALPSAACSPDAPLPRDPLEGLVVERPTCDVTSDAGVASRTIAFTHLTIPDGYNSVPGVNLDALENTMPAGHGATVSACGKTDATNGVDNSAAGILLSLITIVDVASGLVASYSTAGIANDPIGTFTLELKLTHLTSADASDDACVVVLLHLTDSQGLTTTSHGTGTLVGHRLVAYSNDAFVLPIQMPPLRPEDCIDGVCHAAELDVRVMLPTLDLRLDDANAAVLPGSVIAGVVFHDDPSFSAAMRDSGLVASLTRFGADGNLDANATMYSIDSMAIARDLHLDEDGTLRTCAGSTTSSTDRNAISIGLSVDSL